MNSTFPASIDCPNCLRDSSRKKSLTWMKQRKRMSQDCNDHQTHSLCPSSSESNHKNNEDSGRVNNDGIAKWCRLNFLSRWYHFPKVNNQNLEKYIKSTILLKNEVFAQMFSFIIFVLPSSLLVQSSSSWIICES